ncbi:MAG: homoserine kinase [Chloroflexaceae bacterium]|nr:homoserine kinase [Chloroflexaceae bacterium]
MLMPLDIGRVLSFYDLGTLESATRAYRGYVNETVFVQTSQGRFVLRRNHRRLSEEVHRYRHTLITWLVRRRFPTPPVLPTRDGDTLLVLEGRSYEVMPFVNGKDYDSTHPGQLDNVGATLAHYHRAVADFALPLGEQSVRYSAQNVMALTERLIERDVMSELSDILRWYDTRAAHLRSVLSSEAYEQLPHVVIHGDIHRDNFLFVNNEVAALLDFDQVAWDGRIADLADAIVGFATDCITTSNMLTWGVYTGPIIEECATRLVAAYAAVAPLSEAEVWALPLIIELLWLQGELGRVFSTPEGAPDYHLNVLEQGRWLSNWMSERSDHLVRRWSFPRPERGRLILPTTAQAA